MHCISPHTRRRPEIAETARVQLQFREKSARRVVCGIEHQLFPLPSSQRLYVYTTIHCCPLCSTGGRITTRNWVVKNTTTAVHTTAATSCGASFSARVSGLTMAASLLVLVLGQRIGAEGATLTLHSWWFSCAVLAGLPLPWDSQPRFLAECSTCSTDVYGKQQYLQLLVPAAHGHLLR